MGAMFLYLPLNATVQTVYSMPKSVQMGRRHIDIWGDSLPASFPWEPNSEALASLKIPDGIPAYMHISGASECLSSSPWKRFLTPTLQVCDLRFCLLLLFMSSLPGGRAVNMIQLREMIQSMAVKVIFQKSPFLGVQLLCWVQPSLPLPETME